MDAILSISLTQFQTLWIGSESARISYLYVSHRIGESTKEGNVIGTALSQRF